MPACAKVLSRFYTILKNYVAWQNSLGKVLLPAPIFSAMPHFKQKINRQFSKLHMMRDAIYNIYGPGVVSDQVARTPF